MILLASWALGLLSLGAPVAVIYFLKRQARLVPVSSLWLWRGMEQNPKSALRLRWRGLFGLLLQLLALAALVLGLAQPVIYTRAGGVQSLALVIDKSASMRARKSPDGPTLAQQAAQEALQILRANPAAQVTLIGAQAHSTLLAPPTHDHGQIERLLAQFEATFQGDAKLDDLLSLLQSQSPQGFDRVVFLTDQPPAESPEQWGWEVRLVGATERENLAITRFGVREQPDGRSYDLFLELWNSGRQPRNVQLRITADGQIIEERALLLQPERISALAFRHEGPSFSRFVAQLEGSSDDWAEDNIRYAALPRPRPWKVLFLGERNFYLERFFRLLGSVDLSWQRTADASANELDLMVVHQGGLAAPVAGRFLLIHSALPPWVAWNDEIEAESLSVEARVNHPLLGGINPKDWRLLRVPRAQVDPQGQVLITAGEIPLLYLYETRGLRLAYLGVDLAASNLGISLDFPILMHRLLSWLAPRAEEETNLDVGGELPLSGFADSVEVIDPAGRSCQAIKTSSCGHLEQPGFYEVVSGGIEKLFAANPPPEESRWTSQRKAPPLAHPAPSAERSLEGQLRAARALWPYFLAAAIGLLWLELFYFERWPLFERSRQPRPRRRR